MKRAAILLFPAVFWLVACGQKGTISFAIDAPGDVRLSPFQDARRDTLVLLDEQSVALGTVTINNAAAGMTLDVGDVNVRHYDSIRMKVSGGGQLLGLALSRSIDVLPEMSERVGLHARKPLAAYGSSTRFIMSVPSFPPPDPLMLIDTTLPLVPPSSVTMGDMSTATASTHDGLTLFVGSAGKISAIDTGTLYKSVPASAVLHRAGSGVPTPRMLLVSPDDSLVAIVSDQGVSWVGTSAIATLAAANTEVATLKFANARAAAWNRDGTQLAVLAGPAWDEIGDCTASAPPAASTFIIIPVADGSLPGAAPLAVPAPIGATDIAFDASNRLLFAVPCVIQSGRRQVLKEGITDVSGAIVLQGTGIVDVVVAGNKIIGVKGSIEVVHPPSDFDNDSGLRGAVAIVDGANRTNPGFPIPNDSITVQTTATGTTQVRVQPQSLVMPQLNLSGLIAYRAAASPDGSTLTFLQRVRYAATMAQFFKLTAGKLGPTVFYCTLDVTRDIYRVTQIDTTSGAIGFQSTKGVNDIRQCSTQCFSCGGFGGCQSSGDANVGCTVNDGFIPEGLSVMMGDR